MDALVEHRQRGLVRKRRLLVGAIFGVLVLLIVSCGNSDNEDETTGSTILTTVDETSTPSTPSTTGTTVTSTEPPPTRDVLVYFGTGDPDVCAAVAPHERSVPAGTDPIRSGFDQLVAGPTAAEAEEAFSFFSTATEDTVRSATIDDGVLVVDFDDFRTALTPAGANSSCGSGLLLAELNSTAFQFDEVDMVRYELEGSCDEFGEWLHRSCIEVDRAQWADLVASLLPGQPFEGIFGPGATFAVIGVAVEDELNVRALPGADQAILDSLDPLTTGLVYTGRARRLGPPTSIWYEVQAGEVVGWVHSRFVAPLSATFDITNEIIDAEGGTPTGATIEEIGGIVVDARSRFADPKPSSTVVDGPTTGDRNEITYDLVGFGDDSVLGERLRLFIGPTDGGADPLELQRVEVTYLCARGSGTRTDLCP